jgi:hypothetical protein
MQTGADANAGNPTRSMKATTSNALKRRTDFAANFVALAVTVVAGRTAMTPGAIVCDTEPSQIWSKEGLVIPELGPNDFNILKTHL